MSLIVVISILECKDTVFQRDMEIFTRFFSIFMDFPVSTPFFAGKN